MANKKDNKPKPPAPPPKTQQEALRQAQVAVQAAAAQQQQLQHALHQADSPKEVKQIKNQLGNTTDKLQAMRQARDKLRTIMYTTPGTPGEKSAVIDPFQNADDLQASDDARTTLEAALQSADYDLSDLSTSNEYEKANIDRDRVYDRRDASDEAASRGLFQSSVRDAELWDIDATAAIRKNLLDVGLSTQRIKSENAKQAANAAYTTFQENMNRKMIENAQAANVNQPEYLVNPTDPKTHTERLKIPKVGNQNKPNQQQNNKAIYGG